MIGRHQQLVPLSTVIHQAQYGLSVRGQRTGKTPILRMNCQDRGRVVFRDLQYIDLDERTLKAHLLEKGDLLFNRTNSFELVGRTAYFDSDTNAVFASYLVRVKLDHERVDPAYLTYYLNWSPTQRRLKALASRGVSQSNISASKLKDFEVWLPALEQQREIARVLSKIQDAVDIQMRIVATLKELKAATMAKVFREGLRGGAVKSTVIGEIPGRWGVVTLGEVCDIRSGGTPSRAEPSFWGGGIPWVKTGEVNFRPIVTTEETISRAGLDNSSAQIFPPGTVIMGMYGQGVTRGRVARLAIPAATNQACAAFLCNGSIDPGCLHAYLSHSYDRLRSVGHGANQQNLSADILRSFPIALSEDLDEQRQIAAINEKFLSAIETAEHRLAMVGELFDATLASLMSGEVAIAAANENSSSAGPAS